MAVAKAKAKANAKTKAFYFLERKLEREKELVGLSRVAYQLLLDK